MAEEYKKKKKEEKSFLEEFLSMMMCSLTRTAINSVLDNLFQELGFTNNRQQWLDEFMSDASVDEMISEASDELYDAFYQEIEQAFR